MGREERLGNSREAPQLPSAGPYCFTSGSLPLFSPRPQLLPAAPRASTATASLSHVINKCV